MKDLDTQFFRELNCQVWNSLFWLICVNNFVMEMKLVWEAGLCTITIKV